MIELKEVKSKRDFADFIKFPWKIYKRNPYWVPPLISDQKKLLSEKNPFFEHTEKTFFLALKNNELVGRIAGFINHNHNSYWKEQTGFFGFYESINEQDVAKCLLDAVSNWAKGKGMSILRGPMNPSTNDECAFLKEGYDSPPSIMMTYNPPYYHQLMEKYGMKKAKDLYAYYHSTQAPIPEKLQRVVEKLTKKKNIVVRPILRKTLEEDTEKMLRVYTSAWAKNWGFVPITENEFNATKEKLKRIYVPELALLAEVDKKPVGWSLTIPDYNQVLIHLNGKLFPFGIFKFLYYRRKIDQLRLLILGVTPEYRGLGVDALLYWHTFKNAKKLGYKGGEISWILEDNKMVINTLEMFGAKLYKKYRIYEKEI